MGDQVLSDRWDTHIGRQIGFNDLHGPLRPRVSVILYNQFHSNIYSEYKPTKNRFSFSLLMTSKLHENTLSKIHLQKAISKQFYVINID